MQKLVVIVICAVFLLTHLLFLLLLPLLTCLLFAPKTHEREHTRCKCVIYLQVFRYKHVHIYIYICMCVDVYLHVFVVNNFALYLLNSFFFHSFFTSLFSKVSLLHEYSINFYFHHCCILLCAISYIKVRMWVLFSSCMFVYGWVNQKVK